MRRHSQNKQTYRGRNVDHLAKAAPSTGEARKLRQGKEGGKVRYSNRGGTKRELYAELARKGKLKPTKGGTGKGNSKPNSKSTKSGKGKN